MEMDGTDTEGAAAGTIGRVLELRLAAADGARLREWAADGYPLEACGLLLGERRIDGASVREVRRARNLEVPRAADRFEVDPQDFLAADRDARAAGLEVVGFWHSHPDAPAVPSETDRVRAWDGYVYVIVAVRSGRAADLRVWSLEGDRFREGEVLI